MASGTADYTINSNTIVRVGNGTLNIAATGNELVLEGGLVITGELSMLDVVMEYLLIA